MLKIENKKIKCEKCNNYIYKDYNACPYCGSLVPKCPNCKDILPYLSLSKCPYCNTQITQDKDGSLILRKETYPTSVPFSSPNYETTEPSKPYKPPPERSECGGICSMITGGFIGYMIGTNAYDPSVGILLALLLAFLGFLVGYYGNIAFCPSS